MADHCTCSAYDSNPNGDPPEPCEFCLDQYQSSLPMYGNFLGGDPRCFKPDPDGLMPSEFEAWKAACESAESGGAKDLESAGQWFVRENATLHVTLTMFGLGTTHKEPGPWREWAKAIAKDMQTGGKTT